MRRIPQALAAVLAAFSMGIVLVSCGDDVTGPSTPTVRTIEVFPNPATVRVDEDLVMIATMSADSGADLAVTWQSVDPRRVTVTATGILTGVSVGPAVVTATSVANPNLIEAVSVTVMPAYTGVHRITAAPQSVSLLPGQTQGISATVEADSRVSREVAFESDAPAVATVSPQGLVTAVSLGSARIVARAVADTTVSTSVSITVRAATSAQVSIHAITRGGTQTPVDLQNVSGQVDAIINIQPGEATLSRVDLVVSNNGRDTVVASQSFTAAQALALARQIALVREEGDLSRARVTTAAGSIVLSFRSDAFHPTTGTAAFRNSATSIKAVAVSASPGGNQQQSASSSVAAQLNNPDGFVVLTRGLSTTGIASAIDANGRRWMQAGRGIVVTTTPVSFSGRTVGGRTISFPGAAPVASVTSSKPGESVDTLLLPPAYVSPTTGDAYLNGDFPSVVAADIAGNALNLVPAAAPGGGGAGIINAQPGFTGAVRLEGVRIDDAAPIAATLTLSTAQQNSNNWINGAYQFSSGLTGLVPDAGVGLFGTLAVPTVASAGVTFLAVGGTLVDTTEVTSGSQLPASNTNSTYTLLARYSDRLGNTRVVTLAGAGVHPGTKFGVDLLAPTLRYAQGALPGETLISTAADSAFASVTGGTGPRAFAIEALDDRSGLADGRVGISLSRFSQPNPPVGTTSCVIGVGTACTPVFVFYESVLADQFRQHTTVMDGGTGVEGYYTFTATVQDQAGNVSPARIKRALLDFGAAGSAPQITGLLAPSSLMGGQPAAFLGLAQDNVELARGGLLVGYPNLPGTSQVLAYGTPSAGATPIGAAFDATLMSPLAGTHAAFTIPGFIRGLENVDATGAPQAYPAATAKPTSANAWVSDFAPGGVPATLPANVPIPPTAVESPPPNPGFLAGVGTQTELQQWRRQVGSGLRFEAVGPSGQTISPFAQVLLVRLEASGLAVNPNVWRVASEVATPIGTDNGLRRIWTYDFGSQPSGSYIAIGVSAAGDAIATQVVTF